MAIDYIPPTPEPLRYTVKLSYQEVQAAIVSWLHRERPDIPVPPVPLIYINPGPTLSQTITVQWEETLDEKV